MNPIVSVLMTAFNREKYIAEAIESVLASTYKDFELIIVDDCSTDNTVNIAKKYEAQDSKVKVYVNEKNLGDYPNRNKAASYASGKYLKYVDADDYIYPNGLEIIVNQMEAFPNASVGFFSLPQNIKKPFPILLSPVELYEYNFFGPGLFYKAPLSAILRKDSFIDIGGFKPDRMVGDFEMWHRMAQQFNFLLIHDHIVWYREHSNQESSYVKTKELLEYTRIEKYYILDDISPLSFTQRKSIIKKRIKMNLKQAVICLLNLNFSSVSENIQKIGIYKGWKK